MDRACSMHRRAEKYKIMVRKQEGKHFEDVSVHGKRILM
jgi:hypothetical protein